MYSVSALNNNITNSRHLINNIIIQRTDNLIFLNNFDFNKLISRHNLIYNTSATNRSLWMFSYPRNVIGTPSCNLIQVFGGVSRINITIKPLITLFWGCPILLLLHSRTSGFISVLSSTSGSPLSLWIILFNRLTRSSFKTFVSKFLLLSSSLNAGTFHLSMERL